MWPSDACMADLYEGPWPRSSWILPANQVCAAEETRSEPRPHWICDDGHVARVDGDALLPSPFGTQHLLRRVVTRVELHLAQAPSTLILNLRFNTCL
jgi:hypothetical protein